MQFPVRHKDFPENIYQTPQKFVFVILMTVKTPEFFLVEMNAPIELFITGSHQKKAP